MDELVGLGVFDVMMIGIDVFFVVFIVEFVQEFAEWVFDLGWGSAEVDAGKFFDEFCDIIGGAGESGMRKMINTVAESVAIDFFMHGKRAAGGIIM